MSKDEINGCLRFKTISAIEIIISNARRSIPNGEKLQIVTHRVHNWQQQVKERLSKDIFFRKKIYLFFIHIARNFSKCIGGELSSGVERSIAVRMVPCSIHGAPFFFAPRERHI